MNEKKVREAIYCMKASIGETMCEECVNYYGCDHTKMDDMMMTTSNSSGSAKNQRK